jgi:uncharacterized caspase-like protein
MFLAIAVAVTVVAAHGCDAYHRREIAHHQDTLQRLVERKPTVAQVEAALGLAPYRVAKPGDPKELASIWTNPLNSATEVEHKVSQWSETRIYLKSAMVYFVYFDAQGVMRDFSCLSN